MNILCKYLQLNGQQIDFDLKRIHVTVTTPVVSLKKLTNAEILQHVNSISTDVKTPSKQLTTTSKQSMTSYVESIYILSGMVTSTSIQTTKLNFDKIRLRNWIQTQIWRSSRTNDTVEENETFERSRCFGMRAFIPFIITPL